MEKNEKLTGKVKSALSDIFYIMEEKIIQYGRVEDILIVRPDLEKNSIICGVARYENMQDRGENKQLHEELDPYLQILKEEFSANVLYKFITKTWDREIYLKDHAEIVSDRLFAKITDPQYVPPIIMKKKM